MQTVRHSSFEIRPVTANFGNFRARRELASTEIARDRPPYPLRLCQSSAAYRVRIGLNLKGVDYESRKVNLLDSEQKGDAYRALNPQGLVPMLEVDGHRITQSLAILVYLDQTYPEPRLMPADPFDGAHVRAMAMTIACDIHPLNNLRVLKYLKGELGQDQAAIDDWYAHWISEGLRRTRGARRTARGRVPVRRRRPPSPTSAWSPRLFNARRFKVPLDAFPIAAARRHQCDCAGRLRRRPSRPPGGVK